MSLLPGFGTRVIVADGAMGTELQRAGLPAGEAGERWNLDQPDRVEAIHRAYAAAGSEILITNTFGANPWVLDRHGLWDRLEEVNRAAVGLARAAAAAGVMVLGDVGPSGQLLAPLGTLTVDGVREGFVRQVGALLDAGADGIIVETMTALEEATAAVDAARRCGAAIVVASMSFDRAPGGRIRTMLGVAPGTAAQRLVDAGADVIGANCGAHLDIAGFVDVVGQFKAVSDRPIMIQPNAGQPRLESGRAVYSMTPETFAEGMQDVVEAGAVIVGGCCGTTPAHIAALKVALGGRIRGSGERG